MIPYLLAYCIIFLSSSVFPEYEEAIKHTPYVYHPEIKNIKIQIIFYDDESTIFRSSDNPKLN